MLPLVLVTYLADREIKNHINATHSLGSKETLLEGKVSLHNLHNHRHPMEKFGRTDREKDLLVKGSILLPLLCYLYQHLQRKGSPLAKIGTSLLLGGALGNYIERIETGYATDYLRLEVGPKKLRRYVFNLADVAIVLGTFLSTLAILFRRNK